MAAVAGYSSPSREQIVARGLPVTPAVTAICSEYDVATGQIHHRQATEMDAEARMKRMENMLEKLENVALSFGQRLLDEKQLSLSRSRQKLYSEQPSRRQTAHASEFHTPAAAVKGASRISAGPRGGAPSAHHRPAPAEDAMLYTHDHHVAARTRAPRHTVHFEERAGGKKPGHSPVRYHSTMSRTPPRARPEQYQARASPVKDRPSTARTTTRSMTSLRDAQRALSPSKGSDQQQFAWAERQLEDGDAPSSSDFPEKLVDSHLEPASNFEDAVMLGESSGSAVWHRNQEIERMLGVVERRFGVPRGVDDGEIDEVLLPRRSRAGRLQPTVYHLDLDDARIETESYKSWGPPGPPKHSLSGITNGDPDAEELQSGKEAFIPTHHSAVPYWVWQGVGGSGGGFTADVAERHSIAGTSRMAEVQVPHVPPPQGRSR